VKKYHDALSKLSVNDLEDLLGIVTSLFIEEPGRMLCAKVKKAVKDVLECEVPFDTDIILNSIKDGESVDAHVDFGLCPWYTCSGKTDAGDDTKADTSLLGKFYRRLDRSIMAGKIQYL
jgi:hypothetical protein